MNVIIVKKTTTHHKRLAVQTNGKKLITFNVTQTKSINKIRKNNLYIQFVIHMKNEIFQTYISIEDIDC